MSELDGASWSVLEHRNRMSDRAQHNLKHTPRHIMIVHLP